MAGRQVVTVSVTKDGAEKLRALAKKRGWSVSLVVRTALEEYFQAHPR